jgi:polysaccharide biosynthesis protein PslH
VNILFVTQAAPDPQGGGSHRRAAQHLLALAEIGRVSVVLPIAALDDPKQLDLARALGAAEVIVRDQRSMAEAAAAAHASASTRIGRAYRAVRRPSYLDGRAQSSDRSRYHEMFAGRFDLVFAFRLQSALWVDSILSDGPGRPRLSVLDFDDIESIVFKKTAVDVGGHSPFWRWKLNRGLRWLKRTERDTAARWTANLVCSQLDSQRMTALTGRPVWVVPNAYQFTDVSPERGGPTIQLLFVGTMAYVPNAAGVRWFMSEIWPIVRQALGEGASLSLVGFSPPEDIVRFGDMPGVSVVADAPDIAPYYDAANIVIVPLRAGSGTRIKVIEAAAHRRAIVTTTLGCEGLDFANGVHAAVADTSADFAAAIVRLAREPVTRIALADKARTYSEGNFAAEIVRADLQTRICELSQELGFESDQPPGLAKGEPQRKP